MTAIPPSTTIEHHPTQPRATRSSTTTERRRWPRPFGFFIDGFHALPTVRARRPVEGGSGGTIRLFPRRGRWLIAHAEQPMRVFLHFEDAYHRASKMARAHRAQLLVFGAQKELIGATDHRGGVGPAARPRGEAPRDTEARRGGEAPAGGVAHRGGERLPEGRPKALSCVGLVVEANGSSWIVRPLTGQAPVATFRRKRRAVDVARQLARRIGLRLLVRTRAGRTQKELDYRRCA